MTDPAHLWTLHAAATAGRAVAPGAVHRSALYYRPGTGPI